MQNQVECVYLYQHKQTTMKNLIESKLKERTTEQLMEDVRVAKNSTEEGSTTVFCLALNVLEERMTEEEYRRFEDSL